MDLTYCSELQAGRQEFGRDFFRHRGETGFGAHPAFQKMGTVGSYLPGKAAGAWSWPLSADVKNAWSYTSTPPYVFVAWYMVKYRDTCTSAFTFLHLISCRVAYIVLDRFQRNPDALYNL